MAWAAGCAFLLATAACGAAPVPRHAAPPPAVQTASSVSTPATLAFVWEDDGAPRTWPAPVLAAGATPTVAAELAAVARALQSATPSAGIPPFPSCGASGLTILPAAPPIASTSWVAGWSDRTVDRVVPGISACGPGGASGTATSDPGYALLNGHPVHARGLLTALRTATGGQRSVDPLQASTTAYRAGGPVQIHGEGWIGPAVRIVVQWRPAAASGPGPAGVPTLVLATVAVRGGAIAWSGAWPGGVPNGAADLTLTAEDAGGAQNASLSLTSAQHG